MSHTDKAAVDKTPQAPVDIDNVFNDIHSDRERFTKESNLNSAVQSRKMTEEGILPSVSFV